MNPHIIPYIKWIAKLTEVLVEITNKPEERPGLISTLLWSVIATTPHKFTAIIFVGVIFDVGDAVHGWFTYRTLCEVMLPSLGIARMPHTNYNLQGRSLMMNTALFLERVL